MQVGLLLFTRSRGKGSIKKKYLSMLSALYWGCLWISTCFSHYFSIDHNSLVHNYLSTASDNHNLWSSIFFCFFFLLIFQKNTNFLINQCVSPLVLSSIITKENKGKNWGKEQAVTRTHFARTFFLIRFYNADVWRTNKTQFLPFRISICILRGATAGFTCCVCCFE